MNNDGATDKARIYSHQSSSSFSLSSSSSQPPSYAASERHSMPTAQFQIQARGVTSTSSICKQDSAEPILIYRVANHGTDSVVSAEPAYFSLRPKPSSNSCVLVRGGSGNTTTSAGTHADTGRIPVNATIYRWGPGRHPKIRLFSPTAQLPVSTIEQALAAEEEVEASCERIVEVHSRSVFSRDQKMENTPFGTLQWRYAGRAERRQVYDADSLLVLERLDISDSRGGKGFFSGKVKKGKEEHKENRVCVARFVRNHEFRTPGTTKGMAGNGGRLMVFGRGTGGCSEDEKDRHGSSTSFEAFVIASCLCMLKKEVDRMRDNTTAAIV
ncbi:hypothetical protein BD289DRAFT_437979 [Coniella lustricola]|uniref:Uncharacterized protein n=1 Tax=Coniella lustricola TaxID=2025994 RepID=A0A2T3A3F2_9PEZI|nr:hypothetical protein BD289DRAFT_437979 [Coniella lustricola]